MTVYLKFSKFKIVEESGSFSIFTFSSDEPLTINKAKDRVSQVSQEQGGLPVCHSQAYVNCFSYHVGTDKKGLVYFKNKKSKMLFKTGMNPNKNKDMHYNYVLVRHTPAEPGLFDFYVKNGLSDFDVLPTWKRTAPHNIQRKTSQNDKCNN